MRLPASSLKSHARACGFDLCGVARAERFPKLDRLRAWVASGQAGDMDYLTASLDERLDPARVLPTVRSVVCLGVIYNTEAPYSTDALTDGRAAVARYAWGEDYHRVLRERLRALVVWMAEAAGRGFEAFSCVDSGPVQERVFAEQAGLGWIGKNTCLINEDVGSWVVLAEVLCNAEIEADGAGVDRCGTCTRCLDACPTGAIVEPYRVDATRCLSYLTIETRGAVEASMRARLGGRVFGCDICQDVCPWNRQAAVSDDDAWRPRDDPYPRLVDLCRRSDADWRARMAHTALTRAGLRRLRRTLAYALAASTDPDAGAALDAMADEPSADDPLVADAIAWARSARGGA